MRKTIKNLMEEVSLETFVIIVSIFLVTGGFVYATLQSAVTTTNPSQSNSNQVEQNNWNGLVDLLNTSGHCTAATVSAANASGNSLTETNWNSLVSLYSQALADSYCTCQQTPCATSWTDAQSSGDFTKSVWNALVDHIYGKCKSTIANCLTYSTAAKISGTSLTVANWNNLANLTNTTLTNCTAGPSCTPDGCNGNCPANCTVAQDPDCGCQGGNSCCGISCTSAMIATVRHLTLSPLQWLL